MEYKPRKRQPNFSITKLEDGWWFNAKEIMGASEDEWNGPYDRREDALEAAQSLRDNGSQNFSTQQIVTGRK